MAKRKETASERRAREVQESRAADITWEATRCERLLAAMALANSLYVNAAVCYKDQELCYKFALNGFDQWEPVHTMEEWNMVCIEEDLARRVKEEKRKDYLKVVKADLLLTLSDEQKEALGLI